MLYIAGRPHVLRLVDRPLQNVEATGITTDVCEAMERGLKRDVQREVRENKGKILLHDELEESPGNYKITPLYETVSEDDIMTPRDVFELMMDEGYKVWEAFNLDLFSLINTWLDQVDYARVAIVSLNVHLFLLV